MAATPAGKAIAEDPEGRSWSEEAEALPAESVRLRADSSFSVQMKIPISKRKCFRAFVKKYKKTTSDRERSGLKQSQ
ncbi:hypothetical protein CR203_12575 [Salipaludibacillus neizhouensis]|uniref:Uncharacterized protein n=1 Tax=Salipaludibacillus neizhouensis TaxID=885475 RepID=A0A3A9K734_9BACI|nr:hypothetical protein [Salipaludibacillus neizhouensis]RKL66670.1 hypothetical protein CR203_12575 [Salipaludibacillus neizhouensis]